MPIGHLLARRENFGYLFLERTDELLFAVHTTSGLDFSEPSQFLFRDSHGELIPARSITVVPSRYHRADRLSAPTYVELYPTMSCNERCYFCYAGDFLNNNGPQLSRDNIPKVIDNIAGSGVFQLVILGGEPFLYRHLPALLDEAAKTSMVVALSTNATVDRQDVWERIFSYDVHLNLSIHSTNTELGDRIVGKPGATARALRKIHDMTAASVSPHVSMVLTQDNRGDAVNTVRTLVGLGIDSISIFHTAGLGYATRNADKCVSFDQFAAIFDEAEIVANSAGAVLTPVTNYPFLLKNPPQFPHLPLAALLYGTTDGRRVLYVLNDGRVLASIYGNSEEMTLGNLLLEDLATLWNTSPVLARIDQLPAHPACADCEHYTYCRGGPLSNRVSGAASADVPHCPVHVPHLVLE